MNDPAPPSAWPLLPLARVVVLLVVLGSSALFLPRPLPGTPAVVGVTAASSAALLLLLGQRSRTLLATAIAFAVVGVSTRVSTLTAFPVDSTSAVVVAVMTVMLAHVMTLVAPDAPTHLARTSAVLQRRFQAALAACAAFATLPLLASLSVQDLAASTLVVLVCVNVATVLLLTAAVPATSDNAQPTPSAPARHPRFQAILRHTVAPAISAVGLVLWLRTSPSPAVPQLLPLVVAGSVMFGPLLLLLADVSVAAIISLPGAMAASGAALLVASSPGRADAAVIVPAVVAACGSCALLRFALVLPGSPARATRLTSRLVLASSSAAMAALGAAALTPAPSRVALLVLGTSLATFASFVPPACALLLRLISGGPATEVATEVALQSPEHMARFSRRLRHLPPWVRFPAHAKLRFDPMFPAIGEILPAQGRLLDLGSGYGLTAAWLSSARPGLHLTCVEVSPPRAAMASHLAGASAHVVVADISALAASASLRLPRHAFDGVLLLDVAHHVDDLGMLLRWIAELVSPAGVLIVRTSVSSGCNEAVSQRWERALVRLRGQRVVRYRSSADLTRELRLAGFVQVTVSSQPGRPETLFVGRR